MHMVGCHGWSWRTDRSHEGLQVLELRALLGGLDTISSEVFALVVGASNIPGGASDYNRMTAVF
jgi:hypothetical protein